MLTHQPILKHRFALFSFMTQLQSFHCKLLQLLKGNFAEKAVTFK